MARWGFDSASLQLSDSSEKCPHPERANFPLLMTWACGGGVGVADAINSSYLRTLALGTNSSERHISQGCKTPSLTATKEARREEGPVAQAPRLYLDHKHTGREVGGYLFSDEGLTCDVE